MVENLAALFTHNTRRSPRLPISNLLEMLLALSLVSPILIDPFLLSEIGL